MDGTLAAANSRLLRTNSMFKNAKKFNAAIDTVANDQTDPATKHFIWDMSQVTDMDSMFENAEIFDQPLTNWDTTKVQSANSMFKNALVFNNAVFSDGTATSTKTNKIFDMASMFENAELFNHASIKNFQTSVCTSMNSMFKNAKALAQTIRTNTADDGTETDVQWKVEAVTDMTSMFEDAREFVGGTTGLNFYGRTGATVQNLQKFNQLVFGRTDNGAGAAVYVDVATTKVTDMTSMFEDALVYNQETRIDTGHVSTMVNMFRNADAFDTALTEDGTAKWNVAKVTDMTSMFEDADTFDKAIDFSATNLVKSNSMFKNAPLFNQVVFGTVSTVTTKVTDMASMFEDANAYNSAFNYYTDKVTSMNSMFKNALLFNQGINRDPSDNGIWDVGNVVDMTSMFQGADVFDQEIDDWRVIKVTSFENMFQGAELYNKDLDLWAVNAGTNFNNMFNGATQFLQNLCDWQGHNFVTSEAGSSMFTGTKCPTTTVDADSDSNTGSICCGCTVAETNAACI